MVSPPAVDFMHLLPVQLIQVKFERYSKLTLCVIVWTNLASIATAPNSQHTGWWTRRASKWEVNYLSHQQEVSSTTTGSLHPVNYYSKSLWCVAVLHCHCWYCFLLPCCKLLAEQARSSPHWILLSSQQYPCIMVTKKLQSTPIGWSSKYIHQPAMHSRSGVNLNSRAAFIEWAFSDREFL
jgi:hypothetical protein